jgi:hypothetical protein
MLSKMEVGEIRESVKNEQTINTYAVTPTGRVVVTRGTDLWQSDTPSVPWVKKTLSDYFAGQKVINYDALTQTEKFPLKSIATHVVLPSGAEIITAEDRIWQRTSTTVKEWKTLSLIDYFTNHTVGNAQPDKPEEQLPTARWETHAVSQTEKEVISLDGNVWVRNNQQETTWKLYSKEEYVSGPKPDVVENTSQPPVYNSSELKQTGTVQTDVDTNVPPATSWNAHVFTPQGEELIIVDDTVWKKSSTAPWTKASLSTLFTGVNAPTIGKKEKKENEPAEEDAFSALSDQLLEELRKFFRPELLNRFDEISVFRPLTAVHMLKIVEYRMKLKKN